MLTCTIEPVIHSWQLVDGLVRMDVFDNSYILNETGTRIWRLFDGYKTVQEIVEIIHSEEDNNTNKEDIAKAIIEFIEELDKLNFIRLSENNEDEVW